mgnify:CR=1 FL=1
MVLERVNVRAVITAPLTSRSFYADWKTKNVEHWKTDDVANWVGSLQTLSKTQTTDIMCKVRTYDINGQTLRNAEFRKAVPLLFGFAGIHLQTAVNSLLSGTDFLPTHAPTPTYPHNSQFHTRGTLRQNFLVWSSCA